MAVSRSAPPGFPSWGELLESRLATRLPFELEELLLPLSRAAELLDAAHSVGWVHGALDPFALRLPRENPADVTVYRGDEPFPSDRAREADTVSVLERYRAPEVRRGASPSPASDRYALAVLVFESLTLWRIDALPEPQPSLIDPDLKPFDRVMVRALANMPRDRYRTCADLIGAVSSAAGRAPSTKKGGPRSQGIAGWTPIGIAVAASLLFAGGLAVGLSRSEPKAGTSVPPRLRLNTAPPAIAPASVANGAATQSGLGTTGLRPGRAPPAPRDPPSSPSASPSLRAERPEHLSPPGKPVPPPEVRAPARAQRRAPVRSKPERHPPSQLAQRMASLAQAPHDLNAFRAAHAALAASVAGLPPATRTKIDVQLRNLAFLGDGPGLLRLWREHRSELP